MSAPTDNPSTDGRPTPKELTVMILFAGDNDLAALLVSQVKAVKDAGFHENVDVILHVDPSERGVPTRLLHVNHERRRASSHRASIGSGRNSFVRNMGEDSVRPEDLEKKPGPFAKKMKEALEGSDKIEATDALKNFLGYCRENHPAKNYMLFLFGHGLVVGNDAFLMDEKPRSGITLPDLRESLKEFSAAVEKENGAKLHLVGMHSCAMSAIEVAYELRGTAGYMIGSEGIAYVGSWPYENLLVKIFNALEESREQGVELDMAGLVDKLYSHTLHNGTDFVYMGISLDLTLCSLDPRRYDKLTDDIGQLVSALRAALGTERGKEMILLAHWEAQSFWEENYTDLYDFCLCLERRCESLLRTLEQCAALLGKPGATGTSPDAAEVLQKFPEFAALSGLVATCRAVRGRLTPTESVVFKAGDGPVIKSDNCGSQYQYSHGLSVYFPWSRPLDDEPPPPPPLAIQSQQCTQASRAEEVIANYKKYKFSQDEGFGGNTWHSFLKEYFDATQRKPRWEEDGGTEAQFEKTILAILPPDIRPSHAHGALEKPTGGAEKPTGGSGSTCTCPSIKNYPTRKLPLPGRGKVQVREFFATPGMLRRDENGAGPEAE